jgi:thiol-disulfide isomerase/thioredoxin
MRSIKKLAYLPLLVLVFTAGSRGADKTPINTLWSKFETMRKGMPTLHQEFEVTQYSSTYHQSFSRYEVSVDLSQNKWRDKVVGDLGDSTRIFDGQDVFEMEPEGTEYKRVSDQLDKNEALPEPYDTRLDWGKAKELQQLPCGLPGTDHACVVIEAPMKPWMRPYRSSGVTKMNSGTARVMIDTETGMWLRCQLEMLFERTFGSNNVEKTYTLKRLSYGAAPDMSLFKLPEGLHQVNDFRPWDEGRIKKELAGKPAPELRVSDMQEKAISLADLKGKTVLLDFWATWCPPCQADAPAIEKLNQKFGDKDLKVIGISMDEDRETVEKYLKKHPHNFPVVLSSDNLMPRAYQIHVFPTYIVIGPDGTLVTAEQGDQGISSLQKTLKKSGMQTE